MPDRRWNRRDLDLVVRSHQIADQALADLLPKRRRGEVHRLRAVLHAYHESSRRIVPDESMAAHLARCEGEVLCAVCGARY